MNLTSLVVEAHETAKSKGFWDQDRPFSESLMLIVSEAAEALEDWRRGHDFTEVFYVTGTNGQLKPSGIPTELADIVIRVADVCGKYGIDLQGAVEEKLVYNRTRPHRHGGMRA